ncbi:MAG: stage III sporulation protein AG [Firmicutes bacterium]|nr:stage III sporulation protein AG [Bacillota bacterium]
MFSKENSKKFLLNMFTVLIIGIVLLIFSSSFETENNENENLNNEENNIVKQDSLINDYANKVEGKLENILSQMKGVGQVKVMVTFKDTAERIPALNTTKSEEISNEEDAQGGTRKVTREESSKQVVVSNESESLVIIKEVNPEVRGVIVIAEGAENIKVKERLYSAVKTVLGIPGNRVEIYSKN